MSERSPGTEPVDADPCDGAPAVALEPGPHVPDVPGGIPVSAAHPEGAGALAAREETAMLREQAADLRDDAAGLRDETSALGEDSVRAREEAVDLREQRSTLETEAVRAREKAAGLREEKTGLREETATLGEEAVRAREDAADLREKTSTLESEAIRARETAAGLREETSTLGEHALHAREQAVEARQELERLMGDVRSANERLLVSTVRAQAIAADAEQSSLQDAFLATLSHELRTPLNAVLGWAQMLGAHQLAPDRATHAIQAIERNASALAHSLDDLLDVSRIGAGTIRLANRPVDLVALTEAALDAVRPLAVEKRVHLSLSADPRVIEPVRGDTIRLHQVLWNLLANGIKFTPEDGWVSVSLERAPDHVAISVADTGEGISPDFLPYVFEPFRQADGTTTRRHGGLGLGLALVRQLVELHGGTVHAASQGEGCGATFTVCLPVSIGVERMAS